ncbi:MMPL family transporter [Pseudofrankia sp. BMG5.36]|uniref:MMPL family transporter n=1 Tax=Pseudofrankia sp. BMG5.36 TaxID=1834512 RepID=UPI000AF7C7BB|nr:MMPL family transporter [Pseudofrankia sp. BMG5.36]
MSSSVEEDPLGRPGPARRGLFGRVARWSTSHRRMIVAGWLVLLVAGFGISAAAGTRFDNALSLPGSDSQRATDMLARNLPAEAGDVDQIVLTADEGAVTDAAVHAAVAPMLERVAGLPHVASVISPYEGADGSLAISKDRRTAYATVVFDDAAEAIPHEAIQRVVDRAREIRSPQLDVEVGGAAIEQLNRPSVGPATAIGVLAAMVILFLTFGSLAATSLPIATALVGLGVSSGLIAAASRVLTVPDFAEQIAMMIGLGVGVDYALLVVTRFRETYRRNGGDNQDAIEVAMDTAGRSVVFAGLTVVIALSGLYAVGINLLSGVAVAASLSVLFVLAGAVSLLPALLSYVGPRVARRKRRAVFPRRRSGAVPLGRKGGAVPLGRKGGAVPAEGGETLAGRWVRGIQRRPAVAALAAAAALVALAGPALDLRLAFSGASTDASSSTTRKAYDQLSAAFGAGSNGPLVVAVTLPGADVSTVTDRLGARLADVPGVAAVGPARINPARDTAVITVTPASAPSSEQTKDLVGELRGDVIPAALGATPAQAHVGGYTAASVDFTQRLSSKMPLFVGLVIGVAALLLLLVFRSLLIPLQGAVMNLLSIGACLGILQAIFERGWFAGPLNVQQSVVEPFMPIILFAIVFGLSMDYEVFLVARIQEEWSRDGDTAAAIRRGLASTGRVITAAAAIMVTVFASFALSGGHVLQLFGIGLASAIFLDAVVIRMVLLPATLTLLGRATWWLPGWLTRGLPRLAVEAPDTAERTTEVPVAS